jgi:hypothetical protein
MQIFMASPRLTSHREAENSGTALISLLKVIIIIQLELSLYCILRFSDIFVSQSSTLC